MPHFIITTADDNEATAGVLLTDQPMPVPNMKRVASVHQALVRQRYENNNYQGTSTSCVQSTVRGLYVDKNNACTIAFLRQALVHQSIRQDYQHSGEC